MPSFQTVRQPIPTGGWVTSTPSDLLDKDKSPFLENVRFRFGAVYPLPGREFMGTVVFDAAPKTMGRFSVDDQTKWLVLLTDTGMYRWGNAEPGKPEDWFKVSGPTLTGKGRWSWTSGEDFFFFARDGSNGIWRWPGGTAAYQRLKDAPGVTSLCPEQVRFVEYFNNRLLAGSIVDTGKRWSNRVRWPVNGNNLDWDGDGSGFLDFYEPEQEPVQGLRVLGNRCVVFREHSLTDLVATGTLEPVFLSEQRTANVGTIAPYSISSNGLALFFLGNDANVWAWNGSNLNAVGNPIQKTFQETVDASLTQEYLGVVYPFRSEYWLWLGEGMIFILDLLQGRWMQDQFDDFVAMGDVQLTQVQQSWDETPGTWDEQTLTWAQLKRAFDMRMAVATTGSRTLSVGETVVGMENDRSFTCEVQTSDLYYSGDAGPNVMGTIIKTILVYEFNGDTDPFEIAISGDRGRTWVAQSLIPNKCGYGMQSWKVTSNVIRFRYRSTGPRPVFRWTHMVYDIIPGGPYEALDQVTYA